MAVNILITTIAMTFYAQPAEANELNGKVTYVLDGSTIVINGQSIRLFGVAVPPRYQRFGKIGLTFLTQLTLRKHVQCTIKDGSLYELIVGICYVNKIDIAEILVKAGMAYDCPRYSLGRYSSLKSKNRRRISVLSKEFRAPKFCKVRRAEKSK